MSNNRSAAEIPQWKVSPLQYAKQGKPLVIKKAKKSSGKSNKAGNTLPNVNKNASPSKRSTFPVKKNTPNGQGFNNKQSSKTLPGKKNNSSLGYGNKQSSNTFGNRNSQSSNSNSNKGLWDNGKQTQNKNVSNVSPKRNKVKQVKFVQTKTSKPKQSTKDRKVVTKGPPVNLTFAQTSAGTYVDDINKLDKPSIATSSFKTLKKDRNAKSKSVTLNSNRQSKSSSSKPWSAQNQTSPTGNVNTKSQSWSKKKTEIKNQPGLSAGNANKFGNRISNFQRNSTGGEENTLAKSGNNVLNNVSGKGNASTNSLRTFGSKPGRKKSESKSVQTPIKKKKEKIKIKVKARGGRSKTNEDESNDVDFPSDRARTRSRGKSFQNLATGKIKGMTNMFSKKKSERKKSMKRTRKRLNTDMREFASKLQMTLEKTDKDSTVEKEQIEVGKLTASGDHLEGSKNASDAALIEKYSKMQKMGIPEGALRQQMTKDGFNQTDSFFNGTLNLSKSNSDNLSHSTGVNSGPPPPKPNFLAGIQSFKKDDLSSGSPASPSPAGLLGGIASFNKNTLKKGDKSQHQRKSAANNGPPHPKFSLNSELLSRISGRI